MSNEDTKSKAIFDYVLAMDDLINPNSKIHVSPFLLWGKREILVKLGLLAPLAVEEINRIEVKPAYSSEETTRHKLQDINHDMKTANVRELRNMYEEVQDIKLRAATEELRQECAHTTERIYFRIGRAVIEDL
jgi:hypothetical protein